MHVAFLYGPLDSGLLHRGICTRPFWLGTRQIIKVILAVDALIDEGVRGLP